MEREPRKLREREARPTPYGDAPLEADELDDLGDEIRVLAAHLHAGTRHLLGLIARFDASEGLEVRRARGCANWLTLNTGYALRTTREDVRVARDLAGLPETDASMGRGALSFDQVRALTRVATPESETDLLELAEGCSTAVLERECRAWKVRSRKDEAERERELHDSRRLALYPDDNGMHRLEARLMPEDAGTVQKTILRARFALYREETARRLACDCGVVRVERGPDGEVLRLEGEALGSGAAADVQRPARAGPLQRRLRTRPRRRFRRHDPRRPLAPRARHPRCGPVPDAGGHGAGIARGRRQNERMEVQA